MKRTLSGRVGALALLLALASVLASCTGGATHFGGSTTSNAPLTLSMTSVGDTPPLGISILSLQVTITDVRLNPGNVEALAAPVTVDLSRLQTETSLLSSANVTPGTYTSVALTIGPNPLLTFENNTGASLTFGGTQCANGAVCTGGLVPLTDSESVGFSGAGVTLTSSTPAAVIVDVDVSDLIGSTAGTISMDLGAAGALSAAPVTTGSGTTLETIEDVVGVVSSAANGAFTLQTSAGTYTISTNSSTQYVNFSGGVCTTAGFACMASSEIVSVDMSLQTNNTLLASDIFFEDATTALPEIEGVVVNTGGLPTQFSMVVLEESPAASGPVLGSEVTVSLNATPFGIDNLVGTLNTSAFSFAGPSDMIVGQEVQVQQGAGSMASLIKASRVLLRSSRITGTVSTTAFPNFNVNNLPTFLQEASPTPITLIKVETATEFTPVETEFAGTATNISLIEVGRSISVRGQLFANNGSPTLLATRVVQH